MTRVAGASALLALVLLVAGCGGDEEPAGSGPTGSPTIADEPTGSVTSDSSSAPPPSQTGSERDRSDAPSSASPRTRHRRSDSPTGFAGDSGVIPGPSD